jgi:tetrahydromethanopterin S-methyltransferase subunit A
MERQPTLYLEPWPPFKGDYVVYNPGGRVAVVTLASRLQVENSAICGPCVTENLGVEKVAANVISNSNLRYLILCGQESKGHLPGDALLSLSRNGIDDQGRVVGARGAIPFIGNLSLEAVSRFQRQIQVVDRIGLCDVQEIAELVDKLSLAEPFPEPPFLTIQRKTRAQIPVFRGMDVIFGYDVGLDSSHWLVGKGEEIKAEG